MKSLVRAYVTPLLGFLVLSQACAGPDPGEGSASSTSNSTGSSGTSASSTGTPESGSGSGTATAGEACSAPVEHSGEATYYDADGSGNCSFDASADRMIAAINDADYAGSAACGACVEVTGPDGVIDVRIVDRCPGCAAGDLDLSPEAFKMIAAIELGRVDISWHYVPCEVEGPLAYRFKEGSSQWWTALQVRNHRHAIASLDYSVDGGTTLIPIQRENYNYFVAPEGVGAEPFDLRVTDVYGQVVIDEGLVVGDGIVVEGAANTPACGESTESQKIGDAPLPWAGGV